MTTQNHWTKVANLVKTKITVVDNANNRLSGSKLLADIKNGQCLSKWEPELCIKMLQLPGVDNYLAIKKLIRKANKEWIVEFLERDGLGTLMNSLRSMGGKSLMDTIGQLQCVECLRAVVRSRTGLQYISSHLEYSSYLASVLMCNNTTVKLQVYELLCALCVFSADGMIFAKSVLSHVKMKRELRHDYEIVVMELQQADTFAYQTTLLAFVNCLVLVEQNLRKRMRVRNELLALGLRSAIDNMAGYEDEALQIQIAVFEENYCADEIQEPQISHQQLLEKLRAKISNTLYDSYLQNMLLQMSEMDYGDAKVNDVWNLINDVMCNDAQTMLNVYRKTSKTHSTGCQTDGKRLNDRRASLSSPNGRRRSLDVSAKDTDNNNNNSKRTGGFVCKTDRRPSLPRGTVGRGSVENARPVETPTTTARRSIFTQTDRFCDAEPNNDRLTVSSDAVNSCSTSCLSSSAASIPPPPPPPPFSLSEVPAPPPFPVPSAIPPPPPFSLSEVPPPPPLPVPSAIPPSPPFFFSEVPPPPPPPPSAAATSPPLPPTTVGLSELGRTDFAVPNISDGHRTVPTRRTSNNIKYYSLPKTKMKTLNWTKVNNQYLDKSIWSSADPPNLTINFRKIEELFCQKPRAKSSPAVLSPNAASKANVVHVLDSKRSLAINIMLKQFKTGGNEIIEALQNGTSIPLEKLKGLQRVLPTDEEMKTIRKRAGDSATLGTAELFCLDLDSISNYQLRIKLMIEKEELPVTLSEIHAQLEGIKDMCHNLISDQPFKQFLSLVLFIGNYLNAGSYAGNASGFTLDTLPKLLDTRANKPRVTFLHFVVEVAQTNTNDILSFTKYTSALRNLSRISFSSLEDEIKIITKQIRSLHSELSKHTKKQIYTQFSDFMKQSVEDVERLNEVYKSTTEVIGRVAVHFGEDVKKFKIEECLGLLGNFFERIDVAAKENINRRVQEEKNKMLALKLENEKDGPTNIKRRARGPAAFKDEEVCIVDLVLQDIRRGSFNLRSVKSEDEKRI